MKKYTKKDIVKKAGKKTKTNIEDTAKVVTAVFESLRDFMTEDGECRIEIRNFGVFEVKKTAAKPQARNPRKPEDVIYVPPRRKVRFVSGKILKTFLQAPYED